MFDFENTCCVGVYSNAKAMILNKILKTCCDFQGFLQQQLTRQRTGAAATRATLACWLATPQVRASDPALTPTTCMPPSASWIVPTPRPQT